ncbi:MAG: hypothetical protein ACFFC7_00600 [Candidatus Hermodarchaeota archaeon]
MEFKTVDLFRIIYLIFFGIAVIFVLNAIDPVLITSNLTSFLLIGDYIVLIFQLLINVIPEFLRIIPPLLGLPAVPQSFIEALRGIGGIIDYSFPYSALIDLGTDPFLRIGELAARMGGTLIIILFPIAFFSGLGFIRDGDTRLAIISFISQQIILGIALFLRTTNVPFVLDISTILSLFMSPIFLVGFVLYVYLEVSFQCAYALKVLQPMIDREKRIQSHLERIKSFIPSQREDVSESGRRAGGSFDVLSRSYIREMIERKIFRGKHKEEDLKVTMRLQGYLSRLSSAYPGYEDNLTAHAAQTRSFKILEYAVPGIILRLAGIIFLAFLILNPGPLLLISGIVGAVPPIGDSIELNQPEFRTVILIIFVLAFILLGVISYITAAPKTEIEPEIQRIERIVEFTDLGDSEEEPMPSEFSDSSQRQS